MYIDKYLILWNFRSQPCQKLFFKFSTKAFMWHDLAFYFWIAFQDFPRLSKTLKYLFLSGLVYMVYTFLVTRVSLPRDERREIGKHSFGQQKRAHTHTHTHTLNTHTLYIKKHCKNKSPSKLFIIESNSSQWSFMKITINSLNYIPDTLRYN